ncbi:hypothetical protein Tco_0273772 [Tanacetum coccineum]
MVETQGEQPTNPKVANKESTPIVSDKKINEGKELVVHTSKERKDGIISVEDDSNEDDKQPLSKRFKITPPIDIQNLIPLRSFIPEHPLKPEEQQKDPSKGKEIAVTEEQVNKLVQFQEGGYNPKPPKIKPFVTPEGPLTQEKINEQLRELKRLEDLKAENERSKQKLRKMFNLATLKARAQK